MVNAGFHNLVERGIRWACGGDPGVVPSFVDRPEMTKLPKDLKPFDYVETDASRFIPPVRTGVRSNMANARCSFLPAQKSR